jgi:hypothetical protein
MSIISPRPPFTLLTAFCRASPQLFGELAEGLIANSWPSFVDDGFWRQSHAFSLGDPSFSAASLLDYIHITNAFRADMCGGKQPGVRTIGKVPDTFAQILNRES